MIYFLQTLGIIAAMVCIVPLTGLAVTGSWRQALAYTVDWLRAMAVCALLGGLLWLVLPNPGA
jgi:hypothetical protein